MKINQYDGEDIIIVSILYQGYSSGTFIASILPYHESCHIASDPVLYPQNIQQVADSLGQRPEFRADNYMYHTKIRCFQILYTLGKHKILTRVDNNYNISFQTPSAIGPSYLTILYEVDSITKINYKRHTLLVSVWSRDYFNKPHFRHISFPMPPLSRRVSGIDIAQIAVTELYHVDYGISYILFLPFNSFSYCSNGRLILENNLLPLMHHTSQVFFTFGIHQVTRSTTCGEILVTRFDRVCRPLYSSRISINAFPEYAAMIVVSNGKVPPQTNATYAISEIITISEWNYRMNTLYQYGFKNTTSNPVLWTSTFGNKIVIEIITQAKTQANHCGGQHYKYVEVNYIKSVQHYLTVHQPLLKEFKHTPAR
jgi:hypothetical protein